MIKLSRIEICGFRGVRGRLEIDLSPGFTVFTGPNGSGKSSVLDAIEFALSGTLSKYRDSSGEKGESVSDYDWWRGSNPPPDRFVRLALIDEFGSRTTVTRRPEGVEIDGQDSILGLLCDTALNPESSVEELCKTSIIRDELIAKNSVDLAETDRFSFVRAAVGSQSTSGLNKKLNDAEKILKNRIEEAQREYDRARKRVQDKVERLAAARGQASQQMAANDAQGILRQLLQIPTSDIEQLLSKADHEIKQLRNESDSLNHLLSKAVIASERRHALEQTGITARRAELESEIEKLTLRHARIVQALADSNLVLSGIQSTETFIADLALLHAAGSRIGRRSEQCPLCGSHINEGSYRRHLTEIAEEIASHGLEIGQAVERQRGLRIEEQESRNRIEALRASYDRARAEIHSAEMQSKDFEAEAFRINPRYAAVSEDQLRNELDVLKARLSSIEQSRRALANSDLVEKIVDLERDLQSLRDSAMHAEKLVTRLQRIDGQIEEATRALKRLSAEAVEDRLAAIKPLFTELYLRLRPHMDWKAITYSIRGDIRKFLSLRVDENLNLKFLFSSGQRRVTGLAFLIAVALSRPWCRLKTLVLDDPVQHVDDFRAVHLVETLAAIRTMNYQVICSVEDDALADLLGRRLRSSHIEGGTLIYMRYLSGEGAQIAGIKQIAPFDQVMMSIAS